MAHATRLHVLSRALSLRIRTLRPRQRKHVVLVGRGVPAKLCSCSHDIFNSSDKEWVCKRVFRGQEPSYVLKLRRLYSISRGCAPRSLPCDGAVKVYMSRITGECLRSISHQFRAQSYFELLFSITEGHLRHLHHATRSTIDFGSTRRGYHRFAK